MNARDEVREGEIVSKEEERRLVRHQTAGSLVERFSGTVWGNTLVRKRIESARAVVRAEEELLEALRERELSAGRLSRVGAEIEAEALEMENRRREAARRAKTAELQDQLAQKGLEFDLLRLKKATEELQESGDSRNSYQKRLEEAEEKARYETERKIMQTKQRLETVRKLRLERDAMIAEVLNGRREEEVSGEDRTAIDDIRDQFQFVIDGL